MWIWYLSLQQADNAHTAVQSSQSFHTIWSCTKTDQTEASSPVWYMYSKPCVKRPFKNRQNNDLTDKS